QYVVDVTVGSNHSRGTALDLTLRDDVEVVNDAKRGNVRRTPTKTNAI
ncbi:D-alanyl-D-alanine dipeptidase, partial [Shigella flexneri]